MGDGRTLLAADDVSLTLAAGSRTAVVGASGSGKSTLLHLVGGLDRPDAGTISVFGEEITELGAKALADFRSGVGFVFQQFHLIPALSLLDNVAAPLIGRAGAARRRARAAEMLEAVGLVDRASALPSQLSGGQQQRVAIARALVVEPKLLLADEPTGNLDSVTAAEILDLIARVHAEFATTVLLATHDPEVAASCDAQVHVSDGRVTGISGGV
ncbi:ABC transporter ATP-binding protein [Propioniciclava sinopodophylli]|uniref:ABC transporter ATP-binding protein n=2 Tax=Propioniciclava sinopodophylli TaxID=1837344 RepID=A0A4Q9KD53_9ACTN|nr:ABC transporter ATP-binding protein [Propioniciclava sinopodophylli]